MDLFFFSFTIHRFALCDGPSRMPPSPKKATRLLDMVNICSVQFLRFKWHV